MRCEACGAPAPTRKVQFHKHTGAIILMFHSHLGGKFCRSCIHQTFFRFTGWTALAGWWGLASCIITPFVLLWNLGVFLTTLGLAKPDPRS